VNNLADSNLANTLAFRSSELIKSVVLSRIKYWVWCGAMERWLAWRRNCCLDIQESL